MRIRATWRVMLFAIGAFCTGVGAHAAESALDAGSYLIDRWTVGDGLPVSGIASLRFDGEGYLWMATNDGLVRFDGQRFTVFAGHRLPFHNDHITDLARDEEGGIWAYNGEHDLLRVHRNQFRVYGQADGMPSRPRWLSLRQMSNGSMIVATDRTIFLARKGELVPVLHPRADGERYLSAFEDRSGCLLAGTSAASVVRVCFGEPPTESRIPMVTPPVTTLAITQDWHGRIIAATGRSLYRLDAGPLETGQWSAREHLAEDSISAIEALPDDSLRYRVTNQMFTLADWSAAPSPPRGMFPFRQKRVRVSSPDGHEWRNEIDRVERDGKVVYVPDCGVNDAVFDAAGDPWFGTGCNGLVRLRVKNLQVWGARAQAQPVHSVAEMPDGTIWMSSFLDGVTAWRNGERIATLGAPQSDDDSALHPIERASSPMVRALFVARDGVLWIGQHGVCRVVGDRCRVPGGLPKDLQIEGKEVRALLQDRSGAWWAGMTRGLWHGRPGGEWTRIDTFHASGETLGPIRSIAELDDGLWIATSQNGLLHRRADGGFDRYWPDSGLPSRAIRDVLRDAQGTLWAASEDSGVCRGEAGAQGRFTFRCVDTRHGLLANNLHRLIEDDRGRFWFNSNAGIFWVARDALIDVLEGRSARVHPRVYDEHDGLPSREGNGGVQGAGARFADGRIAFPTANGLAVFDPTRDDRPRTPPRAMFEDIMLPSGESLPIGASIRLPLGERSFAVQFSGLSDTLTDAVYFRYRLLPDQPVWQDIGSERTLRFTRLEPGTHTIELAAFNGADGVIGDAKRMDVHLPPHVWETSASRIAMLIGALTLIVLWLRHRGREARRRERELTRQVEVRTRELAERTAALDDEQRQTRAALQEVSAQREQIARLAMAKSRFFANVSHELRTPLAVILGPLRDFARGQAPRPARVQAMLRNGQRLERLIAQMLDLERIDADRFPLEPVPIALDHAVREIVEAFEPIASEAGIRLDFASAELGHHGVRADADQLARVISNLLSNALKFTPSGGRVQVLVEHVDAMCRVSVDDDGPGVPEDWRERIFDRFAQVNSESSRSQEGAGLGLALCREIARLHDGQLHCEVSPLGGARFVLLLPAIDEVPVLPSLAADAVAWKPESASSLASEAVVETQALPPLAASGRPRVLIAEDNPDLRAYLRDILANDFEVAEAEDGCIALECAREWHPDLVISDVMMPNLDGFGLAKALRAEADLGGVPLIFLTARVGDDDEIRGLDLGADQYLRKPFDAQVLLAHVRAALHAVQRLRRRFEQGLPHGSALPSSGVGAISAPAEARSTRCVSSAATTPDALARGTAGMSAADTAPPVADLDAAVDAFTRRAVAWLDAHLHDETVSLDHLASAMAVSRSTLTRRFQLPSGEGPAACLRRLRLQRARALLAANEGNVSEVAYAAGFRSLSTFWHAYREHFGHAPGKAAGEE